MSKKILRSILCLAAILAQGKSGGWAAETIARPDARPADMTKPVQVFILLGQSKMVGLGKIKGGEGSLENAVKEKEKYLYLVDEAGNWIERKDVRFVRVMSGRGGGMQQFNNEWMTVKTCRTIGPEFGIGHCLGNAVDAPVMILKSCIGNRSLGWDLLPPGSERYHAEVTERSGQKVAKVFAGYKDRPDSWVMDQAKGTATPPPPWLDKKGRPIEWYAGKQYDDDVSYAKKVLSDLDKYYPGAKGYEVAGFFFWQGEKDCGNAVHAAHYEQNLVRFIKQLRKDFNAPNAKFVMATLGESAKGCGGNGGLVLNAHLAVDGANGKYPEFKGNVATVYSHPMAQGGSGNGHYGGKAEVYMDVGEAMGKAMVDLLPRPAKAEQGGIAMVSAATPQAAKTQFTAKGQKFEAHYAEQLESLQAEIERTLPRINEQKKAVFRAAREAVKKAKADVHESQQPLEKIQTARALVGHAKGKWIGGAEKGIAAAEAALKKATTEAQRETAKKELARWQANKEAGLKALAERQAALDVAKADEAEYTQASKAANAALVEAKANELNAAKSMMADVLPFLSSDKLDATLVKCAVLAQATPKGLAEFAQQGKEQEALVEKLLADTALMKAMLEADGARGGKYGRAMQIYTDIRTASPRSGKGVLHRLALGAALQHALPVAQRNAVATTDAPTVVDPVKRYLHYEKAWLDGELDPAFKDMSAWECRLIVDSSAPDHVLAWGRQMLRNYRPDHIFNPDYRWRYSGVVRTDVAYRSTHLLKDTDSLEFFQNVIKEGGVCGRRAFFGRFIVQSFGLPSVPRPQPGHASLGRWTPDGWVINLGGAWGVGMGVDGRTDADFVLETQVRKHPADHIRALRAQWVGDALGEEKYNGRKEGSGGLWNVMAIFEKKAIAADAKPAQPGALGTELGEANEAAETRVQAVVKATATDADKQVAVAPNGVITIPAGACNGRVQPVKSFLGGLQLLCGGGPFHCDLDVPRAGKYAITARVVTVHEGRSLQLTVNNAGQPADMAVPYTCGQWRNTAPVEVTLARGKNVLKFSKPTGNVTIKDFTLTPVK